MRFKHVSMVARDAMVLGEFYRKVFGCEDLRPPRTISGSKVSRGNGLPDSEILSVWMTLPGVEGPFLEILQYTPTRERPEPLVNEPGLGHVSFEVTDIQATFDAVVRAGGKQLGEITNFGTDDAPILLIYMRDPEGNIVELEQATSKAHVQ